MRYYRRPYYSYPYQSYQANFAGLGRRMFQGLKAAEKPAKILKPKGFGKTAKPKAPKAPKPPKPNFKKNLTTVGKAPKQTYSSLGQMRTRNMNAAGYNTNVAGKAPRRTYSSPTQARRAFRMRGY